MNERYVSCCKCGGHTDTLVNIGDGKYRHRSDLSCQAEQRRLRPAEKVLPKSGILAAKRPLIVAHQKLP